MCAWSDRGRSTKVDKSLDNGPDHKSLGAPLAPMHRLPIVIEQQFPEAAKLLHLARCTLPGDHVEALECGLALFCLHFEPSTHDSAWHFARFVLHDPAFEEALDESWTLEQVDRFFESFDDLVTSLR